MKLKCFKTSEGPNPLCKLDPRIQCKETAAFVKTCQEDRFSKRATPGVIHDHFATRYFDELNGGFHGFLFPWFPIFWVMVLQLCFPLSSLNRFSWFSGFAWFCDALIGFAPGGAAPSPQPPPFPNQSNAKPFQSQRKPVLRRVLQGHLSASRQAHFGAKVPATTSSGDSCMLV